jgi:hypothetical protein
VFAAGGWSKPAKLSGAGGSNIWPHLTAEKNGRQMAVVWQGARNNQFVILSRVFDGKSWGAERQISEGSGNCWTPVAAFSSGKLWYAWDSYATGAYQIYVRESGGSIERVTPGDNFSVRPSIGVSATGVPVVAWEESDALWGKDFVFLHDARSTTLYKNRRIRVAYRDGREWKEIAAEVAESIPAGIRRFVQQPRLATDADGRIALAFRCRTSAATSRMDFWASQGRWETFVTSLDNGKWTPAVPMPSSVGRNSMRVAVALDKGSAHLVWPTDRRAWPGGRYGDVDVITAAVPVARAAGPLQGKPMVAQPSAVRNAHPTESQDTARIRSYRYKLAGKEYRILRGDLHRHTELSGDGAGDGSLDDLYRYALDAAAMDYAHVSDHQMGVDEEYNWWITQKSNDLYYMPQRFVPMYGYERSVPWPNGHRNIIWAERGKPVLRIGEPERTGKADTGPILYPYLRETKGITTSHTSATGQGTDWRDNDPELEPFVELYQGFESSYEHEGAPRSWKTGQRAVHQGLRPLGYIWNAWAKGHKLGVQSSSDHVSTHASYACILVENYTRQGLLDAMRKRHAYAATDQIVMDFRIHTGNTTAMMGDIVDSRGPVKLAVRVVGTAPIKRIDIIKDNNYIHKVSPGRKEVSFEYVDRAYGDRPAASGESYYYVRAEQDDTQLAWSSPIWVRHAR